MFVKYCFMIYLTNNFNSPLEGFSLKQLRAPDVYIYILPFTCAFLLIWIWKSFINLFCLFRWIFVNFNQNWRKFLKSYFLFNLICVIGANDCTTSSVNGISILICFMKWCLTFRPAVARRKRRNKPTDFRQTLTKCYFVWSLTA